MVPKWVTATVLIGVPVVLVLAIAHEPFTKWQLDAIERSEREK